MSYCYTLSFSFSVTKAHSIDWKPFSKGGNKLYYVRRRGRHCGVAAAREKERGAPYSTAGRRLPFLHPEKEPLLQNGAGQKPKILRRAHHERERRGIAGRKNPSALSH